MTKNEVKEQLTEGSYSQEQVRGYINMIECTPAATLTETRQKPSKLKRGDVILLQSGTKTRPCVIIKVKKDIVHLVPMTTTTDHQVLMPCSGRFYEGSHFSKNIVTSTHEHAIQYFAGVYDKPSDIKKVISALSECFGFLTN